MHLFSRNLRLTDFKTQTERHPTDNPITRGPAGSWTQMGLDDVRANLLGQVAEQVWILRVYERLQARTYARGRLPHTFPERTTSGRQPVLKCQLFPSRNQMYDRPLLVKEGGQIERGRACTDYCDFCATEVLQIRMREAMRQQFRGQAL